MAKEIDDDFFGAFVADWQVIPCRFSLDLADKERKHKITELIFKGGGIIEDHRKPDAQDNRILFVEKASIPRSISVNYDCFDVTYIEDCANANERLKLDLKKYRVNTKSMYEDYDPMAIMLGKTKWSELPRKLSSKIRSPRDLEIIDEEMSDIDDEKALAEPVVPVSKRSSILTRSSKSPRKQAEEMQGKETDKSKSPTKVSKKASTSTKSSGEDFKSKPVKVSSSIKAAVVEVNKQKAAEERVSAWLSTNNRAKQKATTMINGSFASTLNSTLGGRNPYTKQEEESIIRDIVKYKAYNRIRGNQYWQECEERRQACKGQRTWQSMKERFRKKILPVIHVTYSKILSQKELDRFEKCIKGINVDVTVSTDDASSGTEIELEKNQAQSTPKKKTRKSAEKKTETEEEEEVVDSDATTVDDLFAEVEFSTGPTSSPKKSDQKSQSSPNRRKRRKLYTANEKPLDRLSIVNETPSRALRQAKEDYLQIDNPIPSTSRDIVPPPKFKKPAEISKAKEAENDGDDSDSDDNVSTISSRNPYTRSEEKKIIKWLADQKRISETGGNEVWKIMEMAKVVPGRSHQSMKERFRKHILPKIEYYQLDKDVMERFKMHRGSKGRFAKRVLIKPKKGKK